MRIDRPDDGDGRPDAADPPRPPEAEAAHDKRPVKDAQPERSVASQDGPSRDAEAGAARAARSLDYRATVDAAYRTHAIDQGYARIKEIEENTVTPAMRRIEAQDPDRHLVGLEHRLKGRERIEEKVTHDVQKKGILAEQAFADMKDAIRYTFQYPEHKYTSAVQVDAQRLKDEGAEYVDSRNTWASEQYKGINSWWRERDSGQLFEVQFHTHTSFDAKQETHGAYERLRKLPDDAEEVRELRAYQREVNARIPIPLGAPDIVIS